MLDTIKDIRLHGVSSYEKNHLNNIVYQTRPVLASSLNSDFMKKYDDRDCFDIGRSLFLILKLTRVKYNLNDLQEYILTQNISVALDKYSKLVKTDDLDVCVYKNNVGDLYTLEIDEEFINNIKLITSGKNNLLYKQIGDLIIDDYNVSDHPLFKLDIKKIITDNNISASDLFYLMTYTRDMNLINRYIKLLDSNDSEFNKLLLEFIKPATHHMDNFLYGNNVLNYIKDESVVNDYKKCEEIYEKSSATSNVYLIKAFENYFINKIDVLEQVSTFDNRCKILKEMLDAKNEILSYENIYYSIEHFKMLVHDPDYTRTYYVDGPNQFKPGYECEETITGLAHEEESININEKEVDRVSKEADSVFKDIISNNKVNLENLKIKTRKQKIFEVWCQ